MSVEPSPCADCGTDTTPCQRRRGCRHIGRWEFYMVSSELWDKFGAGEGYLCIGCLETRIGRQLNATDFTSAPVNMPHPWNTPRLAAALMRRPSGNRRRTTRRTPIR